MNKSFQRRVLVLAMLFGTRPMLACGPDFPETVYRQREKTLLDMPEGTFSYESAHLVPAPDFGFTLEKYVYYRSSPQNPLPPSEAMGLTPEQIQTVAALRANSDPARDSQIAADLPKELALYTAGAKHYRKGELAAAQQDWQQLLALPPTQRGLRTTWAQFMLGESYIKTGDMPAAEKAFVELRAQAKSGMADNEGLAIASLGEQARFHYYCNEASVDPANCSAAAQAYYGNDASGLGKAVTLYAQQAAQGSSSGAASLLEVARSLAQHFDTLSDAQLQNAVVRSLLTTYALTRSNEFRSQQGADPANAGSNVPRQILLRLSAMDVGSMRNSDRLAMLAYREGEFELAERLSKNIDTARAHWVQAKLALRANRLDEAGKHYAIAAQQFPRTETWSMYLDKNLGAESESGEYENSLTPQCRVQAEHALLELSRGEYVLAMQQLYAATPLYWEDAAYVAERVLTTEELKKFVDQQVPVKLLPPVMVPKQNEWDKPREEWTRVSTAYELVGPATALRAILARRLLREGKWQEALIYFDTPTLRQRATPYADAMQKAQRGSDLDKAKYYLQAAEIARFDGMEILGFEGDPDYAVYQGAYDSNDPSTYDKKWNRVSHPRHDLVFADDNWFKRGERKRLAESIADPLQRFHYRYQAAELAVAAADLLPHYSQAFAVSLCEAARYVRNDQEAMEKIYRRYLRQGPYVAWGRDFGNICPEPNFAKAATQISEHERLVRRRLIKIGLPFLAAALGLMALAVGVRWWRRSKRSHG